MTGPRVSAAVAGLCCVVLAVFLGVQALDASDIKRANELGSAGRYDEAIAQIAGISRAPADARALVVRARALTAKGDRAAAVAAWRAAARRDPNNWIIQMEWAKALAGVGRFEAARDRLARARELNPRVRLPPGARGAD